MNPLLTAPLDLPAFPDVFGQRLKPFPGALAPAAIPQPAAPVSAATGVPIDPNGTGLIRPQSPAPLASVMTGAPPPSPKGGFGGFLDRFMHPTNALGELGRALVMAGETPLGTAYQILGENEARRAAAAADAAKFEREGAWHDQERQDHLDDREYERNKPQFFSGNEDRIKFDPVSGVATTVYDAPTDAETYATNLGLEPGSKEYRSALQDYVLRSNGPTAYGYRVGLEDQRSANRAALKGMPTWHDAHRPLPGGPPRSGSAPARTMAGVIAPILAKVAGGQPLSPGEQRAYEMYQPHRGSGRGSARRPAERIAMAPNGHKLVLRGGKWVPLD